MAKQTVKGNRKQTVKKTKRPSIKEKKELEQKKHLKKKLLEALEKSLGIVTTAIKHVNCSRSTFYRLYNDDPDFKKAVDDIQEVTLDFVESQLHKQIKGGNTAATIFYMKTKGKKRGYIERKEVTGKDGEPLNENKYDLSRLSLEEKKAFLKLTSKIK